MRFAVLAVLLVYQLPCLAQSADLFEAVRLGDLAKLRELAADNVNVSLRTLHQRTALHEAAANCQLAAAKILMDAGWDRLALDDQRQTPAALALRCPNLSVPDLQFILSRLVDRNAAPSEKNPWTIQYAAAHGQANVLSTLLIMGARVNEPGPEGNRALDAACLKGDPAVTRILLDRGADPNLRNKTGSTPLHDAALRGNKDVIELLLRRGAEPNAPDTENGSTSLHNAASFGRMEAVRMLVENGADPSVKTKQGSTPFDLAVRNGHQDIAAFLRGRAAK